MCCVYTGVWLLHLGRWHWTRNFNKKGWVKIYIFTKEPANSFKINEKCRFQVLQFIDRENWNCFIILELITTNRVCLMFSFCGRVSLSSNFIIIIHKLQLVMLWCTTTQMGNEIVCFLLVHILKCAQWRLHSSSKK